MIKYFMNQGNNLIDVFLKKFITQGKNFVDIFDGTCGRVHSTKIHESEFTSI